MEHGRGSLAAVANRQLDRIAACVAYALREGRCCVERAEHAFEARRRADDSHAKLASGRIGH